MSRMVNQAFSGRDGRFDTLLAVSQFAEQIGELQLTEHPITLAGAIANNAGDRELGVVVQDRARHTAEELEAYPVPVAECLAVLAWASLDQTVIAVREIHREEMDLAVLARDCRECFTEIEQRVSWIVAQRHKHLPLPSVVR